MIDPRARLAAAVGPVRQAVTLLRNRLAARHSRIGYGRQSAVPNAGVAVFFATGPENLYQFEQWRLPLEHLASQHPVFVIVDRPDTGDLVLRTSSLPVAFARGSAALGGVGR